MKEWVPEFLRIIGDRNISPEELQRDLAISQSCRRRLLNLFRHNLWGNESLIDIVGSVLADINANTFFDLIAKQNLLFAEFHDLGGTFNVPASNKDSAVILLNHLNDLPFSVGRGVTIHEISHVKLNHHHEMYRRKEMEEEADLSAKMEGFVDDILALRKFK